MPAVHGELNTSLVPEFQKLGDRCPTQAPVVVVVRMRQRMPTRFCLVSMFAQRWHCMQLAKRFTMQRNVDKFERNDRCGEHGPLKAFPFPTAVICRPLTWKSVLLRWEGFVEKVDFKLTSLCFLLSYFIFVN